MMYALILAAALAAQASPATLQQQLADIAASAAAVRQRPEEPTSIVVRQYYTVIRNGLPCVEANPSTWKARYPAGLGFEVLVQVPTDPVERAAAASVLQRLEAAGIPAYPGFRLDPGGASDVWFQPGYFDQWASAFNALWALRANDDPRFGFDDEVYGHPDQGQPTPTVLALYGKTKADLKLAAKPLLDVIAAKNAERRALHLPPVRLNVHPADLNDVLVELLAEASDGYIELSSEESIGNVETTRRLGEKGVAADRMQSALVIKALETKYPRATVRAVLDESLLRRYKGPVGLDPKSLTRQILGADHAFIFDSTRRDNSVFMCEAWYLGYPNLSPLNDVAYVWEWGELNQGGDVTAYPYTGAPSVANGWVNDSLNNSAQPGWVATRAGIVLPSLPQTVGLRSSTPVIPSNGIWTLDLKFELPAGDLGERYPIRSMTQANAKQWQLVYVQSLNRVELQVKTGSLTTANLVVLEAPLRGVVYRTQIGRNGLEWRHGISRTVVPAVADGGSYLHWGLGWSEFLFGAGVRTSARGLRLFDSDHLWYRALSDAECNALSSDGGRYPWGFGH